MTLWKFDADPNDPLVALRIPVTSLFPALGYFAVFHVESRERPTDREAKMISSFIESAALEWRVPVTDAELDSEPFDWFPGYNTVTLHKYAQDDWGYRRRTWPEPQLYPPSPENRFERPDPVSLETVLDLVHTRLGGGQPTYEWLLWKKDHPEVFGN